MQEKNYALPLYPIAYNKIVKKDPGGYICNAFFQHT